jgi:DNA-binding transcriptional LysR family regulator
MSAMDAADLTIFEAAARLGSINWAAAELDIVQSNVTGRIKLLEARLETRLLEGHRRGVALTAAGQRLLPFVGAGIARLSLLLSPPERSQAWTRIRARKRSC